jgi:glycosyltransferase, group 1 family protein
MGKEIIIVTISLGNDGAERILTELARQWHHDGHEITVIQTSPIAMAPNMHCQKV